MTEKSSIGFVRVLLAFLAALATTYVVAALFYSQLNLGQLVEMGIEVSAGVRLQTALHDVMGMVGLYLPILAVGLMIAFAVARLILRWVPQLRKLAYIAAGFVGVFAIDALMVSIFSMHPLAVTRTTVGLLSQCVAGALGGYVFALITAPSEEENYLATT